MDNPTFKSNKDQEKLVQELQELENLLRKQGGNHNPGETRGRIALVRLLDDLDQEDLEELKLKSRVDPAWLTLALDQEKFPALMEMQKNIENLTRARDRDALTGLYNRGFFQRILDREVERAFRFKLPLTLAMMDIDDFKKINDTCGHPCGDRVLQDLGGIIQQEIRAADYAARIGGEEFALILPGTGRYKSEPLFWRIMDSIRSRQVECPHSRHKVSYTVSIGAATYRGKTEITAERLISEVDRQLYKVKEHGKDSISAEIFQDAVNEEALVQKAEKNFLLG